MKKMLFLLPFLFLAGCGNVEFIVPDELVERDTSKISDEANCLNWLGEWDWYYSVKGEGKKQMILTSVKKEEGIRSENSNVDKISGTFEIVNIDGKKKKEHTFECRKDLDGDEGLGKNHGKLFLLLLDGDIREQDIEGQPRRL